MISKTTKRELSPIIDGNSDFGLVELKALQDEDLTPHCKLHGAMNKVSAGKNGYWRCIRNIDKGMYGKDCRAGCRF